jgi:hypothetical protein
VLLDQGEPRAGERFAARLHVPSGTSLIWVPSAGGAGRGFVEHLVRQIASDAPLHEAVRDAAAQVHPASRPLLHFFSDPAGIHDLRMSNAYGSLLREARELQTSGDPGDLEQLTRRLDPDLAATLEPMLEQTRELAEPIREAASRASDVPLVAGREPTDLLALAAGEAALDQARQAAAAIASTMAPVAEDPSAAEAISYSQERRVDIRLKRREADDTPPGTASPYLTPMSVLKARGRYSLEVQIGRRWPESLVASTPPPIDPLLPRPPKAGGHELDVAVFGLDFKVASPSIRQLRLPLIGSSRTESFEVRPSSDRGVPPSGSASTTGITCCSPTSWRPGSGPGRSWPPVLIPSCRPTWSLPAPLASSPSTASAHAYCRSPSTDEATPIASS